MASTVPPVSPPPGATLAEMIGGFTRGQALRVTAQLGIADLLREGPQDVSTLAAATGSHAPSLLRLLRALTTIGIFHEDEEGRYTNTPLGDLLRADHPQSMRTTAIMMGEPFTWGAWNHLDYAIRTGQTAFDHVFGEPFFTYLERRPREAEIFNNAMSGMTARQVPALLAAYDFSGCTKIVDVGGGQGRLLHGILERYPQTTGILADLPAVVADARDLRDSTVAARCEFVGIDMFQSVPSGGDIYLLKSILHDWNDAECLKILRNCRRAIVDGGKLLICDNIIKPANQPDGAKWGDLMMLVVVSGRERTEEEFSALFQEAGFALTRVIQTGSIPIIEGIPV